MEITGLDSMCCWTNNDNVNLWCMNWNIPAVFNYFYLCEYDSLYTFTSDPWIIWTVKLAQFYSWVPYVTQLLDLNEKKSSVSSF